MSRVRYWYSVLPPQHVHIEHAVLPIYRFRSKPVPDIAPRSNFFIERRPIITSILKKEGDNDCRTRAWRETDASNLVLLSFNVRCKRLGWCDIVSFIVCEVHKGGT